MTERPLAVAHRGYSARFAENTLAGCRAAIAAGADLVEADARFSADGTLFSFHDPDLKRLTGSPATIAESRDAALDAVRIKGEPAARLADIIAATAGRAGLLIDVKIDTDAMVEALAATLEQAGSPANVWLGIRTARQAAAARARLDRRVRIVAFMPKPADGADFLAAGADALRLWESELTSAEAVALKARAPIFVTAGGRGTAHAVGDTDAAGLAAILAFGPAAVLLNDPTRIARRVPA